jgi:hypothetical protein
VRSSWVDVLVNPLGECGGGNVEGGDIKSQSQAGVLVGTVMICLGGRGLIERRLAYFLYLGRRI